MNKAETAFLLQMLTQLFPGSKVTADELTVCLWQELFSDFPAQLVIAAAKQAAVKTPFMPSIYELRREVADVLMKQEGRMTAGEAWAKVKKAISNYGYYRAAQAREALGEEIWHAVEMTGGWSEICMNEAGSGVISGQFAKRFEAAQKQHREQLLIPAQLKEEMKKLAAGAGQAALEAGQGERPAIAD